MSDKRPNLFTRDDTFFGVCQGIGEDLRIPPDVIRLSFVPVLFLAPPVAIAAYFVLGFGVLVTHWLIREPAAPASPATKIDAVSDARPIDRAHEDEAMQLAA